ncbi:OprD family outer membrane porin [Sulfuricurvum sp.]|uniref:OprD family outer membrane porin n=1 Tax=Sulfuricurvum sp. TaxID=2025608 RepID=UPI002633DA9C|nr:OprD family outer membrane porin [Sulfuricurvum sp.]MDD3597023.1 OprD family outer membrane porin [Sulfuricurvum sp.]
MKKTIVMSLAAAATLSATTSGEAFIAGKTSGEIRSAYISNDYDTGNNTYGTSVGGILKYETGSWNNLSLGVAGYISQRLGFISGDDAHTTTEIFDEEGKSYAYIAEAYIDYTADNVTFRIGRQQLDTPFADTDDIRMNPNTFEAAVVTYSGIDATTLVGGYVTRWAGYDSGDDKSTFKRLGGEESDGTIILGIQNESIENLAVQGWYYGVDKLADLYYADAAYTIAFSENAGLELAAQYARFSEDNDASGTPTDIDGSVYGIGASLNIGAMTLGAAYNRGSNDDGKAPPIGFGGGPYMTSMEEWTIEGMEDVKAYQLSAELDLSAAGAEGLTLSALYGDFKSSPMDMRVKEFDLIASYEINEAISADISYADIDDRNGNADGGNDAGYKRFLARLHYIF